MHRTAPSPLKVHAFDAVFGIAAQRVIEVQVNASGEYDSYSPVQYRTYLVTVLQYESRTFYFIESDVRLFKMIHCTVQISQRRTQKHKQQSTVKQ